MAVDTNKLAALVEEQNQNPLASMPEVGGEEDEMPPEEEAATVDGQAILDEMGEFGAMLVENADMIVPIAEEIGEDLAGDSEYMPETEDAVADAVDRMPPEMVEGLAENVAERPLEELNAVGEVLVASVETTETPIGEAAPMEAEQVGGLLEVAAKVEGPMEEEEPEMLEEEEIPPAEEHLPPEEVAPL
jgi:hypothetical protein